MKNAYLVADKASWKEMDGLIVVVNTESGAYYALNKTASEIWKRLAAGSLSDEVQKALEDKFEVSAETVAADLEESVAEWLKEGLIVEK